MGRSSGSRINLQATPSHGFQSPQWPMWRSSPVTAAGPQRICTVFPLLRIWISFPDRHPCRAQSQSYQDKLGRQATRSFSSRGVPGTAYASSLSSAGVPNRACTSSLLFPRPGAPRLARIQGAFASAGRIGLERHPVASSFSLVANAEPLEMSKSTMDRAKRNRKGVRNPKTVFFDQSARNWFLTPYLPLSPLAASTLAHQEPACIPLTSFREPGTPRP